MTLYCPACGRKGLRPMGDDRASEYRISDIELFYECPACGNVWEIRCP